MIPEEMIPIIVDAAIVVALVLFTWLGARKGLILTLFGLLAVVVAWFGASFISSAFSRPIANIIRPSIQKAVSETVGDKLAGALSGLDFFPAASAPSPEPNASAAPDPGAGSEPEAEQPAVSSEVLEQIKEKLTAALDEVETFSGIKEYLEKMVSEDALDIVAKPVDTISSRLADLVATAGLFVASYLLILLVWFLVSRALDLAFQLPILKEVNMAGGGVLGLVKGLLVVFVCVWFLKLAGVLTEANIGPVAGHMSLQALNDALSSTVFNT